MGTPATRAKDRYNTTNYDEVKVRVPKGYRDELTKLVTDAGYEDRSKFILDAIREKLEREGIK
jgi:metal-responsive CopG/Arc/MetJ family transcriptional regulator